MRLLSLTSLLTVSLWWAASGQALGQAPANCPEDTSIDTLRERDPSELDNQFIDEWLTQTYSNLTAGAEMDPDVAAANFLGCMRAQYGNEKNSVAFNRRFAERIQVLVQPEFAKGSELGTAVSRALATMLADLAAEPTREVLLQGLEHRDQVVRYQCAKALTAIRPDVAADARLTGVTLTAIGKVGAVEANDVVAAQIYRACAYPDHQDVALTAILTILDGRLKQMRKTGQGFGRAELVALRLVDRWDLNNTQRVELVKRLAPLLRLCTVRYGEERVDYQEKTALQELIDESEALIRKVVNPSNGPNVSEKMQRGGDAVAIDMQIELNLWIGTEQDEGVLNKSPWSIERGAP